MLAPQPAHFLNKKGLQTTTWNQMLAVICNMLFSVAGGHIQGQSNRTCCPSLHAERPLKAINIIQQLKSSYFEVLKPPYFTGFSPLSIRMD